MEMIKKYAYKKQTKINSRRTTCKVIMRYTYKSFSLNSNPKSELSSNVKFCKWNWIDATSSASQKEINLPIFAIPSQSTNEFLWLFS